LAICNCDIWRVNWLDCGLGGLFRHAMSKCISCGGPLDDEKNLIRCKACVKELRALIRRAQDKRRKLGYQVHYE